MSSLKWQITLWYVLAMVFVSIVVFGIMNSLSLRHMEETMELRVTQKVDGLAEIGPVHRGALVRLDDDGSGA